MTIDEIKAELKTEKYDFLRNDEHLGENIILLGLGGSHAYGTEKPDGSSDIDIRGFAFNTTDEILTNMDIDWQVAGEENSGIDACIYSFMKMMKLLSECNPNCVEILGLRPEHYLYVSPVGQELLDNKDMFLSKLVITKFLGYSSQQLHRLKQLAADGFDQSELEKHILHQLERMSEHFMKDYTEFNGYLNLYIDKSEQEDMDTEIYMDVNIAHYPLRDYCKIWNTWQNTVKAYKKIGKRNNHANKHEKMGKHSMQLIRLFDTCADILEKHEFITYREAERDEYIDIRNGKYLTEDGKIKNEFFELVESKEAYLDELSKKTTLPEYPDYKRINNFIKSVNERVVRGEI